MSFKYKIGRNDPCWCGSGKKWKKCHFPDKGTISTPFWHDSEKVKKEYLRRFDILIKSKKDIEGIRAAGHLAASILDKTCQMAKEGVTTEELNAYAHQLHLDAGAVPAPLGYGEPPYPKSICTSINEVVCHGIPDETYLKDGDIMNIDITVILNGYYGDCSKMVMIGDPSPIHKLVTKTSFECLEKATQILRPGILVSEIGSTIEAHAQQFNLGVVDQFVGHGVGINFHEAPQVPHYANYVDIPLVPGMTFTIEPMINGGSKNAVIDDKDQWTARTVDSKPSAQFEYTLLITEDGYENLTPWTLPDFLVDKS